MLDVDHFKAINDTYGHGVGDAVLVATAARLRTQLRPTDSLARWGGEEFICVITHVTDDGLFAKAQELCHVLAQSTLLHSPQVISISASFGVALYEEGQSVAQMIECSDQAMYRAKKSGRNRVCR